MTIEVPQGFRVAGIHCGIKRNPQKEDLTLIVCPQPAVAAGVYTQNLVHAAPVVVDRERTPTGAFRVLVANSGNANACTGPQGERDARQMARWAAQLCEAPDEAALVLSTGLIGAMLPMEKIQAGIQAAAARLASDADSLLAAARGILTTDTYHKLAGRTISIEGKPIRITGMAKGAGMIGPNMATMLAVVMTDAPLDPAAAQQTLAEVADVTFNCISVEGHMSTNDTALLLASGAAGGEPLAGEALAQFATALREVCEELARAIPSDGEGATHLITIDVAGCASREDARQIAKTIADSPLVKCAVAGGDPNWGRIVSAVGYAGPAVDPGRITLRINDHWIYENGRPAAYDLPTVAESMRTSHETRIVVSVGDGEHAARFWTCDMTDQYIRINTDYPT